MTHLFHQINKFSKCRNYYLKTLSFKRQFYKSFFEFGGDFVFRYKAVYSHEQNRVNTTIIFRVVCHLRVLAPDNLATLGDQTKLGDVDLDHRSFCNDSQTREHGRTRVLFHPNNRQTKCRLKDIKSALIVTLTSNLELRMCDVRLFKPQRHWPDKTFIFRHFSRKIFGYMTDFCHLKVLVQHTISY